MTRSQYIKEFMTNLNDEDIVIASTGFISREVFKYDRPLNFYMQGSMGNALSIGIGLAMHTENRVFVLQGDGSALMGLGSLITAQHLKLLNLYNIILDNNCHESTGGQRTVSECVDFKRLYFNTQVHYIEKDDTTPPRITLSCKEISRRFKDALLRK